MEGARLREKGEVGDLKEENRSDNRHSVRIDSRILFGVERISPEKFERIDHDCRNGISFYNRQELAEMQVYRSAQNALARIKEKDRDLAIFLRHLDAKLDLLLTKTEATPSLFDTLVLQKVNLGGNGLGFWSSEEYAPGEIIEVHIIIPLDNYYLNCFAEVVESKRVSEDIEDAGKHRISVKFALINEHDREVLVRFNFKQQGHVLQNRRLKQGA